MNRYVKWCQISKHSIENCYCEMSFWFLVSIKCYHRPPGAVELSSPSSGPVSRFVDQCRFNAGVANAPRRRRWPFRKPAGLLEPSGSLLSKKEEHETRKKEVSCCFRAASTIFRKLDQMRQKNERGCFWPTDNTRYLSKERKFSSLWSYYPMLKATIKVNHNISGVHLNFASKLALKSRL
jgi:hypothetical protein